MLSNLKAVVSQGEDVFRVTCSKTGAYTARPHLRVVMVLRVGRLTGGRLQTDC